MPRVTRLTQLLDGSVTVAKLAADVVGQEVFLINGNFTAPHAGNYLVLAFGGGGGGGGGGGVLASANERGSPGYGGGGGEIRFSEVTLAALQVVAVTIGSGGAGGAGGVGSGAVAGRGTPGSTTLFAGLLSAFGGNGGGRGINDWINRVVSQTDEGFNGHGYGGGGGGLGVVIGNNGNPGVNATQHGAGGGGGSPGYSGAGVQNGGAGGDGSAGILVVTW